MSNWNMPPGVSTNDIPGQDDLEAELESYIASHREGVRTSFDYPPIPDRSQDWSAIRDGYEPGEPVGRGATEEEAILDLLTSEWERADEPRLCPADRDRICEEPACADGSCWREQPRAA